MSVLTQALQYFVDNYHADNTLVAEQSGWSCGICLQTEDGRHTVYLGIENGRVVHLGDSPLSYSLIVRSDLAILLDILEFRRDPNEPYLFGELTIQGAENDFMRLDYIVARLCYR